MDRINDTLIVEKNKETDETDVKKQLYTINEVANILKVHQQTLRNCERKKLVIPLRAGTRRIYTYENLEKFRKIKEYSGKGVSLRGIKQIIDKI